MPQHAWKKVVQHVMKARGMKYQQQLAEAADIHAQTVSRWLSDKPVSPNSINFAKMATFAGVGEDDLSGLWAHYMKQEYPRTSMAPEEETEDKKDKLRLLIERARKLSELDFDGMPGSMLPHLYQQRQIVRNALRFCDEMFEMMVRALEDLRADAVRIAKKNEN